MATSWHHRQQEASDRAWRALRVDPMSPGIPHGWRDLALAIARELRPIVEECTERMDDDNIDADAVDRIMVHATATSLAHCKWAITEAIGNELARPEPQPFSPPPAGAWLRQRLLPRTSERGTARLVPEWWGKWHRFNGDWKIRDVRAQDVIGRTRCGARLTLRDGQLFDTNPNWDVVVIEEWPDVDACRKCSQTT